MQFMKFDDWLGVMPGWLQALPESLQDIIYQVFQTFVFEDRWYTFFLNGLKTTFIIAIGALILGIIIGVLVAVVRSAHDSKRTKPGIVLRVINAICKLYLVIIRGTPVMVQLLLMGFVIMVPQLGTMEATWCAIITFGITRAHTWRRSSARASWRLTRARWRPAVRWALTMCRPCVTLSCPRTLR